MASCSLALRGLPSPSERTARVVFVSYVAPHEQPRALVLAPPVGEGNTTHEHHTPSARDSTRSNRCDHDAGGDLPARLDQGAGLQGRPGRRVLHPGSTSGEPAQGPGGQRDHRRRVRRRRRVRPPGRPARADADDRIRQDPPGGLLHRPQGRPARAQPRRRRRHPPRAQRSRRPAGLSDREHRRDPLGDAVARDHVHHRGVLLPQPRQRGLQGHEPEGRHRWHQRQGPDGLPQRHPPR